MKPSWRKLLAVLFATLVAAAFSGPAVANPFHKCNSGNGNGSEPVLNDCDPGNSGGNNNGGD